MAPPTAHTDQVTGDGAYLTLLVPLILIGLLVLILRWAFSRGHSLVARPPRSGGPTDYGLLVSVASPAGPEAGELLCRLLADNGIQATVASTRAGPRLMVWPADVTRARQLLDRD